jgi:hypothetical protein
VSATKVATRTSMSNAPPWSGSSRRRTAWAKGNPIQSTPNEVTAIDRVTPAIDPRDAATRNITGNAAAPARTIWKLDP